MPFDYNWVEGHVEGYEGMIAKARVSKKTGYVLLRLTRVHNGKYENEEIPLEPTARELIDLDWGETLESKDDQTRIGRSAAIYFFVKAWGNSYFVQFRRAYFRKAVIRAGQAD